MEHERKQDLDFNMLHPLFLFSNTAETERFRYVWDLCVSLPWQKKEQIETRPYTASLSKSTFDECYDVSFQKFFYISFLSYTSTEITTKLFVKYHP